MRIDNECRLDMYIIKEEGGFSNTYILPVNDSEIIVVDPANFDRIQHCLFELSGKMCYAFLTHEHWDHIAGLNQLRNVCNVKVISTEKCSEGIQSSKLNLSKYLSLFNKDMAGKKNGFVCDKADILITGSKRFNISNVEVNVYETPGHSQGSCCIQIGNMLFTGDTMLNSGAAIFRMPNHDMEAYRSITMPILRKLLLAHKDMVIYPGHGEKMKMSDSLEYIAGYVEG